MLDMYKTIRNAMQEREDKYISFPDLVDYLRSVNNGHVQDSIIGDYLLFIFKRFNPYEFGDKADFFPIYISMDLSDVTRELEISYDQEVFFNFAHSLCDGSFRNKDYWYFFLEKKFVFNEINIDQQIHENLHNPSINSTELQAEKAKNTQLQAENERLKAELKAQQDRMAELEQKPQQSAVDYGYHSIYGHSSENFEIIFKVSKIIAEKCDPDNPHSYPTKAQITKYVKQYFNDSEKLCEAIYQVVIPEKVKMRGKPPEGVETFKSFI